MMRRSYATSHNHPARPGSWATSSEAALSKAVGPGAEYERTTPPTMASASNNPSVGRRDRGASDAEEKILTPASRRVFPPAEGGVCCFELTADGDLLYSKLQTGKFPDEQAIVDKVASRLR